MNSDARVWLRENGYVEIVEMINAIMAEWKTSGKRTRRNWWEVMAGTKAGKPRVIEGRVFPILAAARERSCLPPVASALRRRTDERAPDRKLQARWAGRRGVESASACSPSVASA